MKPRLKLSIAITASVFCVVGPAIAQAEWQPKQSPLTTRWAKDVRPENPLPEYPRPQFVRDEWRNLNGLWKYAIRPKSEPRPEQWDGDILVPFPVESALSGVMRRVGPDNRLWYQRTFALPQADGKVAPKWADKNVLLNFGAVDWETTVWVNGKEIGSHKGGYDPFTFDITTHLKNEGPNELVVSVYDPSDAGFQPRGKQVREGHGIWYTPTTGIWQTVWIEPVDRLLSIAGLQIEPDVDASEVRVNVMVADPKAVVAEVTVKDGGKVVGIGKGSVSQPLRIPVPDAKLWSPGSPHLYDVEVSVRREGNAVHDPIRSYFAMRKISIGKDDKGITRMMLNNAPLFQFGPLDQGFWPDGLYTAPTDEALRFDIEITKKYGFNMIRKHVKVEPSRWYYHCDKLGILVWQDMPSGDLHAQWDPFGKFDGTEAKRSAASAENFRREWQAIIDSRRNHPCIVMWVPFNEGWGQADTVAITKWTKEYDPSRLVNCASGGNDFPVGDVIDVHRYPGPFAPKPTATRVAVLGEYGGLGLPLKGHTWQGEKNWGYQSFTDQASLTTTYLDLLDKLHPMIESPGLSAAIYTQTTDVEIEVNGLLTYDRAIQKIPVDAVAKAHQALYSPPPRLRTIVESSRDVAQTWQYTLEKPAEGWQKPAFDASAWKSGPGGFGERTTPKSVVRTEWKSSDIWLRRTFELKSAPAGEIRALIHHDEDTEIYVNGQRIKSVSGYSVDYGALRLGPDANKAFRAGTNTLAIHCKQTGGGQYIDIGFVEVE